MRTKLDLYKNTLSEKWRPISDSMVEVINMKLNLVSIMSKPTLFCIDRLYKGECRIDECLCSCDGDSIYKVLFDGIEKLSIRQTCIRVEAYSILLKFYASILEGDISELDSNLYSQYIEWWDEVLDATCNLEERVDALSHEINVPCAFCELSESCYDCLCDKSICSPNSSGSFHRLFKSIKDLTILELAQNITEMIDLIKDKVNDLTRG